MNTIKKANENTLKIFNCLKSYGCDKVFVYVPQEQIALECKINICNISIHIKYLIKHGYIDRWQHINPNGHRANNYRIRKELTI